MDDSSLNVSQVFDQALLEYDAIENSGLRSNDPEFQKQVSTLLSRLSNIEQMARSLNLYSENEFFEELSTSSLKLMVCQYYLGQLELKHITNDRKSNLQIARNLFISFLKLVDNYDLLDKSDKERLSAFESGDSAGPIKLESREAKINRFKREKALEQDIKDLQQKLDHSIELESDGDKEELMRDLLTSRTRLFVNKAFNELTSVAQELDVLSMMPPRPDPSSDSTQTKNDDNEWRLDNLSKVNQSGPLMDKTGKPLRPFVITGKQQELRDQVFRPSWRLPSMTIDEYLDKQVEMGNFLTGGGERPTKPEIDDNDEEAQDRETYKKREEDEFKDHNPRGWGNRYNKG